MKKIKLTREEKKIEEDLIKGKYQAAGRAELERIAKALARRKKDAVLNMRVNSEVLERIKRKAKRRGIPYQSFITEVLQHLAA